MASSQTDVQSECTPGLAGGLRSSSSIARQSSIYSLTLDEFQNVLGEPTKNFGSMNMDEFLKNIWTVEESQAMAAAMGTGAPSEEFHHGMQRQASISLPRTLSRKTVDDVWKDIARDSIEIDISGGANAHERQVTFGEMTLEDFLVKAGVVKKDDPGSASILPLGMSFENTFGAMPAGNDNKVGDRFGEFNAPFGGVEGEKSRVTVLPTLSLAAAGANMPVNQIVLEAMPIKSMNHVSPVIQSPEWLCNNGFKTDIKYTHPPVNNTLHQHAMEASARKGVVNGGLIGGLGVLGPDLGVTLAGTSPASLAMKTGSPQSPLMDGVAPSYDCMALHSPLPYGVDGIVRGRKRDFEGSLEKVVERRQKRMIKNRESAARSRARKQAYTVELEAEVSHLKEENMRLRRHEEEMAERRRRQLIDVLTSFGPKFMPKACRLRRTHTGPW